MATTAERAAFATLHATRNAHRRAAQRGQVSPFRDHDGTALRVGDTVTTLPVAPGHAHYLPSRGARVVGWTRAHVEIDYGCGDVHAVHPTCLRRAVTP